MTTMLEQTERRLAALPEAERGPRQALLRHFASLVVDKPLGEVVALLDEVDEGSLTGETQETWSLAEARTRNLERVLADQARLIKESIRAAQVRQALGISRQRLHQLVSEGRLVAVQLRAGGNLLYPFWQFTSGMPVQPIAGLERLIDAARQAGMDEVELHFFMVEPNERLDGRAPYELSETDLGRVIEVLRGPGLGPF